MAGRIGAAIVAANAWFALGLQLLILIDNYAANGDSVASAVWRFLAFFTILTNAVVAIVMSLKAMGGQRAPSHALVSAATLYIVIVGLVYTFVLAALWKPEGRQLVADSALHYVSPILTALYWLALEPKGGLRWRDALNWLAFPAAYLVYAIARAQFDGFYPYPFVDLPKIGTGQFVLNAIGLLAAFAGTGCLLVWLDGVLAGKPQAAA